MFRLIRWLFLVGMIAALAGFLLTYPMAGRTAAERVCGLAGSRPCEAAARQWGAVARRWEARLRPAIEPHGGPATTARRSPRVAPSRPLQPPVDAPPLDRHTPEERQALGRILAQRGSR